VGREDGISLEKIAELENFAASALFSDAEKAALRMAEAMCERSVTVSDEIFVEVRRHFEEKAIVEIAATIALENMRARFNRALEIPSDGFCELPLNHPALSAVADLTPNPFPLGKGE
jgi:alkylhydroperoxidase family enzyme